MDKTLQIKVREFFGCVLWFCCLHFFVVNVYNNKSSPKKVMYKIFNYSNYLMGHILALQFPCVIHYFVVRRFLMFLQRSGLCKGNSIHCVCINCFNRFLIQ